MLGANSRIGYFNMKQHKLYFRSRIFRFGLLYSAVILSLVALSVFVVDVNMDTIYMYILLLIASVIYDIISIFAVFKNYLMVNLAKKVLVYRCFPGFKKKEIPILYIQSILLTRINDRDIIQIHYKSGVIEDLKEYDNSRYRYRVSKRERKRIENTLLRWNEYFDNSDKSNK